MLRVLLAIHSGAGKIFSIFFPAAKGTDGCSFSKTIVRDLSSEHCQVFHCRIFPSKQPLATDTRVEEHACRGTGSGTGYEEGLKPPFPLIPSPRLNPGGNQEKSGWGIRFLAREESQHWQQKKISVPVQFFFKEEFLRTTRDDRMTGADAPIRSVVMTGHQPERAPAQQHRHLFSETVSSPPCP